MKNESKMVGIALILIVIIGFIAFGVGMAVQRVRTNRSYYTRPMLRNGFGPGRFMMGNGYIGMRTGALNGIISNISGNQVTVKLPDGTTRTATLSSATQYSQLSTASQSNLQQGQNVTITGQLSQDGSLSAQTLRINPSQ